MNIWDEVDAFLKKHHGMYRMSFGLEYSNTTEWVAAFAPRINHQKARYHGEWAGQSEDRDEAIRQAMASASASVSNEGNS